MSQPDRIRIIVVLAILSVSTLSAFWLGIEYSRSEIRWLAEELAAQPTNTFSRCLTEMWELSGELDPEGKGKRRWQLTEAAP